MVQEQVESWISTRELYRQLLGKNAKKMIFSEFKFVDMDLPI